MISKIIHSLFSNNGKENRAERTLFVLGTIVHFKVYGKNAEIAINLAVDRLNEIDDKLSVFKENSEISHVNSHAGGDSQVVSSDTYYLLKKSLEYSKLLDGTFDPTIRPLVDLWSIGSVNEHIPEDEDIKENLKLVNYKDISLNDYEHSAALRHKYQSIDLGGIAKGYAADEIRDIFIKKHIKSALIDLGGNIFVLGAKTDGTYWNVGIQDPLKPRGEFVGILNTLDKSVVTSGNYEKFFIKGSKKYHHIIDPRNGYPSESNLMSVTIVSDNSLDGDGLSTGIYILGVDKAMKLIESINGIDAIFVTEDKKIYLTSGIKGSFKCTNPQYQIINYEM